MKKVLLLFTSLILSLLLFNNKVYAQQLYPIYPSVLMKLNFTSVSFVQENEYTYEYKVYYTVLTNFYDDLTDDEYYLIISHYIPLRKGINRNTNSYILEEIQPYPEFEYTNFVLRVTLLKSFIIENGFLETDPTPFFRDYSALYVLYFGDPSSIDYEAGYSRGYTDGYNRGNAEGYSEGYYNGYTDGAKATEPLAYQRGYDDGYNVGYKDASNEAPKKFMNNLHQWIVPAIIVVVVAGIFVGYRRERYYND